MHHIVGMMYASTAEHGQNLCIHIRLTQSFVDGYSAVRPSPELQMQTRCSHAHILLLTANVA